MTAKDAIRNTINFCRQVTLGYLKDFTDADLLVRSVPAANHTAWQLGHLLVSERDMVAGLGHEMPDLPHGFTEAYAAEAATSNDPGKFSKKADYLDLMESMRAATLGALDATPEAALDKPAPEAMRSFAPTVGSVFMLVGTHELMHAGQFVPIRRKLGKPVTI
jgi:hypothetical protein